MPLDITSNQFIDEYPETERVARHSFLVLSVTAFEDYMKDALSDFLIRNWKPSKTYRIAFKPQDLPQPASTHDWLKEKAIQTIVDDYMGRSYSSRFEAVSKLVFEFGGNPPTLPAEAENLAAQACEARNCIVHASGVADVRAVANLQTVMAGIQLGAKIDIQEPLLWQFLGALRDSARALDIEIRSLA